MAGESNVRAPIVNSLTSIGSLASLGAVAYSRVADLDESYYIVRRKSE